MCIRPFHIRTYELPSALTDQLLTPSLVVYMPFVRSNISRMLRHIAESPVRYFPAFVRKVHSVSPLIRVSVSPRRCATALVSPRLRTGAPT